MVRRNAKISRSMLGLDLASQISIGAQSVLARSRKLTDVHRCHALFVNTDGAGRVDMSWIRVSTTNLNLSVRCSIPSLYMRRYQVC